MATSTDEALKALIIEDPERGWRAFVDQHTPTLVALIERAGVTDHDALGDVYVQVCERLAEDDCARLRRWDPGKGALAAWLTIVVRHVLVDWIRSRDGRRRLFGAIRRLDRFDQRVFELYYWESRRPAEIAGLLETERKEGVDLLRVLDALARIQESLSDRHRSQLAATIARARRATSLETGGLPAGRVAAPEADPEERASVRQLEERLAEAIGALAPEDAAILRLMFVQGFSRADIQRALGLDQLCAERVRRILDGLRSALAALRIGPAEAATPGLSFLEGDPS